jgi:GT2 family glycosyltransferase
MSAEPPLVSVVIPVYNRRDSVLQLLADVYRQEGVAFEVIVVDDCSPDDTVAAITTHYPAVRLFRNTVNGGPAVSRNRGVREALGEFVVGFDSDVTVPDPTVLRRAAETFRKFPEATGLAFRLLSPDGKTDDAPRWWHPVPIERYANERFSTHYFSGTGYAFRRSAMVAAGLYPEILYMHYEEVELAFRILDNGGTIMHCPDIPVLHHANPIASRSKIKVFYKPRNQILVALALYSWPRALCYLVPRLAYNFAMSLIQWHPGEFWSAMGSARKLAPHILAHRVPLRAETWRRIREMRQGGSAGEYSP